MCVCSSGLQRIYVFSIRKYASLERLLLLLVPSACTKFISMLDGAKTRDAST